MAVLHLHHHGEFQHNYYMEVSVSHSYHNGGVIIFMVFLKAIPQTTAKVSNGEPLEKESTRNASGLVYSV